MMLLLTPIMAFRVKRLRLSAKGRWGGVKERRTGVESQRRGFKRQRRGSEKRRRGAKESNGSHYHFLFISLWNIYPISFSQEIDVDVLWTMTFLLS